MDLNEIKNLIESKGGKFIIVENGKPILVIYSFEEYMKADKLKLTKTPNPQKNLPKELEEEELKIEDLPFTSKG